MALCACISDFEQRRFLHSVPDLHIWMSFLFKDTVIRKEENVKNCWIFIIFLHLNTPPKVFHTLTPQ